MQVRVEERVPGKQGLKLEDCKHLDSDQIYAAMYGAVKKLIQIVENQQKEIEKLKSRLTTKEIKGV